MSKFCPFCGEELVDSAKFCKNCGKSIENYTNSDGVDMPETHWTPPVEEKSYTWALVIGILFSLFIPLIGIVIGIYVYTRKDSSKAKLYGTIIIALGVIVWIVSMLITFMYGLY
jgi:uncharacterized membrane protein YvbJ